MSRRVGDKYEFVATKFLEKKGYKILFNNYYTRYGEIDIIAYKDDVYIFCEVKYRSDDIYGVPAEFVNKSKQQKIVKSAMDFIMRNSIVERYRFDIIGILGNEITHIEDAFTADKSISNF